ATTLRPPSAPAILRQYPASPMLSRRAVHELLRLGFPLCGWLSLALFVLVASGVPIPLPIAKDLSQPFPCMFGRCGCRNAEQCWNHCCCHSVTQRLAWAKARGVTPPASLVAAAEAARLPDARKAASAACCNKAPSPQPATTSCCTTAAAPRSPSRCGMSLIDALKCQGSFDMAAGVALCLPPPTFVWQPDVVAQQQPPLALCQPSSLATSPTSPPPASRDCCSEEQTYDLTSR